MEIIWCKITFVLVLGVLRINSSLLDGFELKDYFRMPLLSSYDPYDPCMYSSTTNRSLYCVARTKIKPDPSNKIWNYTKEFSDVKMLHFRHDVITRGVCIESCLKTLAKGVTPDLDIEDFNDEVFTHDPAMFKNTLRYRKELQQTVNMCVNLKLKEQFNLTGYSTINHCDAEDDDYSYDYLDKLFIFIVLVIIATATIGTVYDLKYHDKKEHESTMDTFLMAFSLPQNYKRLMVPPHTKLNQYLEFIQGLRFLTMFWVIFGHIDMGYNMNPANPEYFELRFHNIVSQLFLNGTMFVQTFFMMSGGLLSVHFIDELMTKKKFNFIYFWIAIIYRYVRLTPVYALVLLFDATLLNKTNRGPFWKPIAEIERNMCRRNWYQNLLYVNNYFNIRNGCMAHTWYLAADTQLFVFGMLVMMAVWRFPKWKKVIIGSLLTIAVIIPGIVTYIYKLDGSFTLPPENKRDMTWTPQFRHLYVPAHMNAASFLFGIVAGFIIHQSREKTLNTRDKRILGYMFWLVPILGIVNMEVSNIFYFIQFEKPAVWIALFSIVSRLIWGLLSFVLIFAAIFKASTFVNKVFSAPIFQPLGRVTYCIYLVHMPIMRVLGGGNKGVVHINTSLFLSSVVYCYIVSTIVGGILCLTLEFPITALTKMLIDQGKKKIAEKNETNFNPKGDESTIRIDVIGNERHDFSRETRQI